MGAVIDKMAAPYLCARHDVDEWSCRAFAGRLNGNASRRQFALLNSALGSISSYAACVCCRICNERQILTANPGPGGYILAPLPFIA